MSEDLEEVWAAIAEKVSSEASGVPCTVPEYIRGLSMIIEHLELDKTAALQSEDTDDDPYDS